MRVKHLLLVLLALVLPCLGFGQVTGLSRGQADQRYARKTGGKSGLAPGRIVTSRNLYLSNSRLAGPVDTTYRQRFVVRETVPWLDVTWVNDAVPLGTAVNPITVNASYDYLPGATTISNSVPAYSVVFGASASATIAPKGYATARIPGPFLAGDAVWIRTHLVQASGGYYPVGTQLAGNGEGTVSGDGTTQPNYAQSFSIQYGRSGFGPSLITGPTLGAGLSVALLGDSIMDAAGEDGPQHGQDGFAVRALDGAGVGWIKLACAGEKAADVAGGLGLRLLSMGSCTAAICEYETNDVGNGDGYLTVAANLQRVWRQAFAAGMPVYQTTPWPKTTSADLLTTVSGQTVTANEGNRVALRGWLDAGAPVDPASLAPVAVGTANAIPSPYLAGIIDVNSVVEVNSANVPTKNGGYWRAPSASDYAGSVTSSTATVVTMTGASFPASSTNNGYTNLNDRVLAITGGTGAGQTRTISANTATTVTVGTAWTTTPDATSTYAVYTTYGLDGTHPTTFGHVLAAQAVAARIAAMRAAALVSMLVPTTSTEAARNDWTFAL